MNYKKTINLVLYKTLKKLIKHMIKKYDRKNITILILDSDDTNLFELLDNNITALFIFSKNKTYNNMIQAFDTYKNNMNKPNVEFMQFDITNQNYKQFFNISDIKQFDIVSCYNFHKYFKSELMLFNFFRFLNRSLNNYSYFIGSGIDDSSIYKMFMSNNIITSSNYYIENLIPLDETYEPYNNQILLKNKFNKSHIYNLISLEEIKDTIPEFNMKIIGTTKFYDFTNDDNPLDRLNIMFIIKKII